MKDGLKKEVVQAAQKIIFGQEGNYGSVNANDNGAVSVGKVQWHAGRALALLKKICAAESRAASILGAALYAEITTAAAGAWSARTVNAKEKAAISALLTMEAGKRAQDAQAEADVGAYVEHGLKAGVEDPAALVYFADMENQGGGGASARVANAAKKPVKLDTLHAAGLADRVMGKYSTRRKNVYKAAQKLTWSGAAQETNGGKNMIKTARELAAACVDVAQNYKTLYVMGCFGAPMNAANKTRYCNNHQYNRAAARQKMIKAASADTFGFDCVCLIKGLLWGWNGDAARTYGGAQYTANGVPDVGADGMIKLCKDVSTTGWGAMQIGEAVWCAGHIGVYIGDGLAVECSPKWENKVQITAVKNIGTKAGYNARTWTKHGKIPYVTYDGSAAAVKPATPPTPAKPAAPAAVTERKATGAAKSLDRSLAGTYTVTAGDGLHIRNVAGASDGSMVVLPYGTKVQNYGYYTQVGGVKWLYIQVTYNGVKYTGFSSGKYLKKK